MAGRDSDSLGSARDEAERLVAAGLAAAQFALRQARRTRREREGGSGPSGFDLSDLATLAGRFLGDQGRGGRREEQQPREHAHAHDTGERGGEGRRGGWQIATGSDACCVCPICRAIDLLRDPSPEFVERIASGASDLASGVTSVLRAFGTRVSRPAAEDEVVTEVAEVIVVDEPVVEEPVIVVEVGEPAAPAGWDPAADAEVEEPGGAGFGWAAGADFSDVWQAATRAADEGPAGAAPPAPKPMARKAVKKAPTTPPEEPTDPVTAHADPLAAEAVATEPGEPGGSPGGKPGKAPKAAPAKAAKSAPAKAAKSAPVKVAQAEPVKAARAEPAKAAEAEPAKAAKAAAKKATRKASPREPGS